MMKNQILISKRERMR